MYILFLDRLSNAKQWLPNEEKVEPVDTRASVWGYKHLDDLATLLSRLSRLQAHF